MAREHQAVEKLASVDKRIGMDKQLRVLFQAGRAERFEDGMHTTFAQELETLVKDNGDLAIIALRYPILSRLEYPAVAAQALRCLGQLDDRATHEQRRWLLVECLVASPELMVRDGAALGLASLDDPWAIPFLELAVEFELVDGFRQDLEQILAQLRMTQQDVPLNDSELRQLAEKYDLRPEVSSRDPTTCSTPDSVVRRLVAEIRQLRTELTMYRELEADRRLVGTTQGDDEDIHRLDQARRDGRDITYGGQTYRWADDDWIEVEREGKHD